MCCLNRTRTLFGSFACVLITAGAAHGFTWYVDENADTTPHNGTSWCQAFLDLQGALAVAGSGDTIHVADGTYKPTSGTDRTATHQLKNGVTIEGGYAGCGAGDPDERDIETYETILSGDIGAAGTTDNSYQVVTASGTDDTGVLDGFTITAGNANASTPYNNGGGMTNISGDPTVANCTFTGNSATFGGGMSVRVGATAHVINCVFTGNTAGTGGGMLNNGEPTVTDCTFSGNSASSQGGGMANINEGSLPTVTDCTFSGNTASHGGGMYNYNNAEPTVTDCTFSGNSTTNFGGGGMFNDESSPTVTRCSFLGNTGLMVGGGMYNYLASPAVTNCTFVGNSASGFIGGGMINNYSSPTVTNCTFSGNTAADFGGGMVNNNSSNPAVTNCTFSGNLAGNYGGGMSNYTSSNPTVTNCIFWGDTAPSDPEIYNYSSTPAVTYSDVQGGYAGETNIDADPLFVDAISGDLRLGCDSPCVDQGNNGAAAAVTTDLDGNPRFVDDAGVTDGGLGTPPIVDMGAYERQFDSYAGAMTIYVDDDTCPGQGSGTEQDPYCSIQFAIDATCDEGDEIVVAPGTYYEAIDFQGKGIDLHSSDGRDVTTIDATGLGTSVVKCDSGEGSDTILDGFTITGGTGTDTGDGYLRGGGMYNFSASPTVANCTFSGNTGTYYGGGMHNSQSHPTVTNCTFAGNSSERGGGMSNYIDSNPTVTNCTFIGNEAPIGGGMINATGSSATVTGCTFTGNHANQHGGGICSTGATATVMNCAFSGNTAGTGGAMSNHSTSPTIANCTFSGNTAGGGSIDVAAGGGMYNHVASPTVTNCTFTGNAASLGGGAMANYEASDPAVTNCIFTGNTGPSGGAMLNRKVTIASDPTVTNCTFSGNSADYGGGMRNHESSPTVTNCVFSGNSGTNRGGGMSNSVHSDPTVTNCTFSGNTAGDDGGGGMSNYYTSSPTVTNCIFWGDSAASGGPEIWNDSSTPVVTYSDVQGGYPGATNIDADPLFARDPYDGGDGWGDDPATTEIDEGANDDYGDLRLSTGSPCIDTGDNTDVTEATDLDGNPRVLDGDSDGKAVVDMGAYEYPFGDCNENDIPDICDLDCEALGGDCNVPDCGQSSDDNTNGVPDECECPELAPPSTPAGEAGYEKIRYISMVPGNAGYQTALRVTLTTLPAPFDGFNDTSCWVGEPQQVSENSGKIAHEPGWPDFMSAHLQGSPLCMDWSTVEVLHVTDDEIIPSAVYDVQAIECQCDFENEDHYSAPLTITTSKWGDSVGTCAVIPCSPPEGVVNMATDVTACFDKFRNLVGAVLKSRADIEPNLPDGLVNISDCTFELDAFRGFAYPPAQTPPATGWPGPDGCP